MGGTTTSSCALWPGERDATAPDVSRRPLCCRGRDQYRVQLRRLSCPAATHRLPPGIHARVCRRARGRVLGERPIRIRRIARRAAPPWLISSATLPRTSCRLRCSGSRSNGPACRGHSPCWLRSLSRCRYRTYSCGSAFRNSYGRATGPDDDARTVTPRQGDDVSRSLRRNTAYRIERSGARAELGIGSALPLSGLDIWTAYELNWLDRRGKPHIAVAEIRIEAQSPAIVESKHMTRAGWATCGPSLGQHAQRAAR